MRRSLITSLMFLACPISASCTKESMKDLCERRIDELSHRISHNKLDEFDSWFYFGEMMAYEDMLQFIQEN